jgi:hypothetical protein
VVVPQDACIFINFYLIRTNYTPLDREKSGLSNHALCLFTGVVYCIKYTKKH